MKKFKVVSPFKPAGDQEHAISQLSNGIKEGKRYQTLKGVTGSGKTFSMANIIERVQKPTLIISHNKTLAAQLYREFRGFFPNNAVEYFVSYYDYYQPEAYVVSRDLYIEKDASINEEIEKLRLGTTTSLMERRDVIVVASVSCIYGLGNPEDYRDMRVEITVGFRINQRSFMRRLVKLQYTRNDFEQQKAGFRSLGDVVEVYSPHSKITIRIEFFGDEIERICKTEIVSGKVIEDLEYCVFYPAKHFVTPEEKLNKAIASIRMELTSRYNQLIQASEFVEAERLKTRCEYDLEMLTEMGFCSGVENYSRHLSGRKQGERPAVLLDFFPKDFLLFIDESHVTIPQIGAMYSGDQSRKQSLVKHGFRLPSALDNRPLNYCEFEQLVQNVVYISATPAKKEIEASDQVVEQIIRPTGLLDPEIDVRYSDGQIENLYKEIKLCTKKKNRVLVTTLTKRMAEDLSDYLIEMSINCQYIHSEVNTFEREEILRDLRSGIYDVIVGVNLLREGLDLPEVALIVILDADKVGFLRSTTSLIQIIGRAARNVEGRVIMYCEKISNSMQEAITETERRRKIQLSYNETHGITPKTIQKKVQDLIVSKKEEKHQSIKFNLDLIRKNFNVLLSKDRTKLISLLEKQMLEFSNNLEFENAATVRDEINILKDYNS